MEGFYVLFDFQVSSGPDIFLSAPSQSYVWTFEIAVLPKCGFKELDIPNKEPIDDL